jgi:hypothetical protein
MPELSFHAVLKVATGPGVILHLAAGAFSSPSGIQFFILIQNFINVAGAVLATRYRNSSP